ncbi:MAG: DUF1573 domain-containing protein [Bacteroidia bacterium]
MKNLIYIIFIIAFAISSCNKKNSSNKLSPDLINNPASASGESKGNLPVFEWAETRFHFGDVKAGEKVTHTFKFKNIGTADLVIASVSPSCGCTVPVWSKEPVKPGDEGKIDVTFNSEGKSGMESKTIAVLANTIPSTRVLTISAEVIPQPMHK